MNEKRVVLSAEDRKLITRIRSLKPIKLGDDELVRLVAVLLDDLGHSSMLPRAAWLPTASYYDLPLAWFEDAVPGAVDFAALYMRCVDKVPSFRLLLQCLCALHTRRRKFDLILRTQPVPTMDQVARRGLLEHGIVALPGLTSWLTWRKWIYDVDNRSGQETGYLFEPMLATSLGGEDYGARSSPVTRGGRRGAEGRQVDCIVDAGEEQLAYEFKVRVTDAASGQGRFKEEVSFPRDCRASGFKPVLLVMDPTPSDKLAKLIAAFEEQGGECFLGEEVWQHVRARSGDDIAAFVQRYIRDPIVAIAEHEEPLLDLRLCYSEVGTDPDAGACVRIVVGGQAREIVRPRRNAAVAIGEEEP